MIQQISEEQYRLLINNRTLFKNIKHIKKKKIKYILVLKKIQVTNKNIKF